MKKGMTDRIKKYLAQKKRKRKFAILLSFLSVIVAAAVWGLLMSPAEAITSDDKTAGIDLAPYITDADFETWQDGAWTEKDTYVSGESVRAVIHYDIPKNVVSADARTLCYTLPAGIAPLSSHVEGTVYSDDTGTGTRAGTYTIDTDESGQGAVIMLLLDETFVEERDSFKGSVWFDGRVYNTSKENITVTIDSTTITVTPPPESETQDIQVQKEGDEGTDSDQDGYPEDLGYTLIVSSTKGTGDNNVRVHDEFILSDSDVTGIGYDKNSLIVRKTDGDGNVSDVNSGNYTIAFGTADNGNPCFDITGLAPLGEGESYRIAYRTDGLGKFEADTNGSVAVKNCLTATAGDKTATTWKTINITNGLINKYGSYNSSTGKIIWTIDIYPEGRQMKGYTLSDFLNGIQYTGEVTIKRADKDDSITVKLPYTFQEENTQYAYRVTYSTDAGTEPGVKVTNKAILTPPSDKDWPSASSESEVQTYETQDFMRKSCYGTYPSESGETAEYRWNVALNISSEINNTEFVYEDILTAGRDGTDGTDTANVDAHYITPALLKESLDVSGTKYGDPDLAIKYEITGYQVDGAWKSTSEVADDTRATGFRLTFAAQEYTLEQLSITYHTAAVYTSIGEGETGCFWNEGKVPELSAKGKVEYTKEEENTLTKQIRDDSGKYTDADATIIYTDGILHYRVLVATGENDNGEITVTDLLPAGASYVDGSLKARFYVHENDSKTEQYYYNAGNKQHYDFTGKQAPKVEVADAADEDGDGAGNRQEVVITIQQGYNGWIDPETGVTPDPIGNPWVISLDFDVSVADDPLWQTNKEITYTNEVTWERRGEAQQTSTVDRSGQSISKSGSQITADEANGDVIAEYRLDINRWGETLGSDGEIELKDTLHTDSQYVQASLIPDSVALYRYDGERADGLGEQVLSTAWSFNYDPASKTMTIRVPDQTRYILVYRYRFEWIGGSFSGNDTDHNVTNTLTLTNRQESESTDQTEIRFESSGAWVEREPNLTIYKVDSENYSIALPGVSFNLEKLIYDGNNAAASRWEAAGSYTTDENGQIQFSDSQDSAGPNGLERNVLYRLTETQAAEGYRYDSEDPLTVCFVWLDDKTESDFDWIRSLNDSILSSEQKGQLRYITASYGAAVYVPNEYARLTVDKRWLDENGAAMTPGTDQVTVRLYRQAYRYNDTTQSMEPAGDRKVYGKAVTLSRDNGWSDYWDNLPKQDENGNEYRYFIEEDPVPGYTTETDHPNGVQTGTVTITNRFNGGVELPETGGIGRTPVYMTGTALLAAAGAALITGQQRRRRKEDGRSGRR